MEWSNEITIEFLNLYENESIIWHPGHKLHKNRNEVHDSWKRIQSEFSLKVSVADLKKKKESLMATFRNCLSKIKASEKSGSGTDELYKPTWFAFTTMARFLTHHDTPRKTFNSDNTDSLNVEDGQNDDEQNQSDIANISASTAEPSFSATKRKATSYPVTQKTKKVSHEVIYEKMEKAYDILQKKTQPKEKDECDLFGELLAKRLRAMEQNERDFVMHEIEKVMYQSKMRFSQRTFPQSFQQNSRNWQSTPISQNLLTAVPSSSSSPMTDLTVTSSPTNFETYSQYSSPPSVSSENANNVKNFYENFQ